MNVSVNELINHLITLYPNVPNVCKAVAYTISSKNTNCLLYGLGGHAKSTIIEAAIKFAYGEEYYNTQTFLHSCSRESEPSHFFGHLNIKTWRETGVQSYNVDNILFMRPTAVLEEGLDLNDHLLTGLRDALTRGQYCTGSTCAISRLKNLFICTNVDPVVWAKTDSQKALIARFQFVVKAEWQSYEVQDFMRMFASAGINDEKAYVVSMVAAKASQSGTLLSPRDTMNLYKVYSEIASDAVEFFNGITPPLFEYFKEVEQMSPYFQVLEYATQVCKNIEDILNTGVKLSTSDVLEYLQKLDAAEEKLSAPGVIPSTGEFTEKIETLIELMRSLRPKLLTAANYGTPKL
jgi:hypothetical protein